MYLENHFKLSGSEDSENRGVGKGTGKKIPRRLLAAGGITKWHILPTIKALLPFHFVQRCPDAAQGLYRDTQVRRDVLHGDLLDDLRIFVQKRQVAFESILFP